VVLSASLLSVLAGAAGYMGIAVAFVLVTNNGNGKAYATGAAYLLAAFVFPILAAGYLVHSRRWPWVRALRLGASVCLVVHACLLPVAVAALAM